MQPFYPDMKSRVLWLLQSTPALGHWQFCAVLMGVLRVLVGADVITWTECMCLWLCCRYFGSVMAANDTIDAALAGLSQDEVVRIQLLANESDWDRYEAARGAMFGKVS